MITILTPKGEFKTGNSTVLEDYLNVIKYKDASGNTYMEPGTLILFKGNANNSNLQDIPIVMLITNNQYFSYKDIYNNDEVDISGTHPTYNKWAEFYRKDNLIKIKLLTQDIDANDNVVKVDQGYFYPTGDENPTDLTGYTLMYTLEFINNYTERRVVFFNNMGPNGLIEYVDTQYGGDIEINDSGDLPVVGNSNYVGITCSVQTLTKTLENTITDVIETVSDLSSESAARFVTR